jgi:hypothetical protein
VYSSVLFSDNDGFKIHLFGSYSGLSLKKVADNLRGDPSSSRTVKVDL